MSTPVPPFQPFEPARKRRRRKGPVIFLAVCAGLLVTVVTAVSLGGSGASAKYSAHVQDQLVVNPADLAVTIRVANTGTAAGTPQCTIDAQDPSYTYTGVDVATLSGPVAAGKFAVFTDNLTITKEGARFVTQVTVSCT